MDKKELTEKLLFLSSLTHKLQKVVAPISCLHVSKILINKAVEVLADDIMVRVINTDSAVKVPVTKVDLRKKLKTLTVEESLEFVEIDLGMRTKGFGLLNESRLMLPKKSRLDLFCKFILDSKKKSGNKPLSCEETENILKEGLEDLFSLSKQNKMAESIRTVPEGSDGGAKVKCEEQKTMLPRVRSTKELQESKKMKKSAKKKKTRTKTKVKQEKK